MSTHTKRKLIWSGLLLATLVVVIPIHLLNLIAHEDQKLYWCDPANYSSDRCHEAESAVTQGLMALAVMGLLLLMCLGILLDQVIMPKHEPAEAT